MTPNTRCWTCTATEGITQLAPERRFYQASQTAQTMVANHSTLAWDLYVVYEGKNPDTGLPIIKLFLDPLVAWIWIGEFIVIAIGVALTPILPPLLLQPGPVDAPVEVPESHAMARSALTGGD